MVFLQAKTPLTPREKPSQIAVRELFLVPTRLANVAQGRGCSASSPTATVRVREKTLQARRDMPSPLLSMAQLRAFARQAWKTRCRDYFVALPNLAADAHAFVPPKQHEKQ